jgi:hypothetical protein
MGVYIFYVKHFSMEVRFFYVILGSCGRVGINIARNYTLTWISISYNYKFIVFVTLLYRLKRLNGIMLHKIY